MNNHVPKETLSTSTFNNVFLKIYLYDPSSKFKELESGSDSTSTKRDFSQTKKL